MCKSRLTAMIIIVALSKRLVLLFNRSISLNSSSFILSPASQLFFDFFSFLLRWVFLLGRVLPEKKKVQKPKQ